VLRSFRKQSFKDKYDFNLIYPTTDDAVRHILKVQKEEDIQPVMIGNKMVVDIEEDIDEEGYSPAVYKAENDSYQHEDEYETYVHRF